MVKLEDKFESAAFYFRNRTDCDAFMSVFRNHMCNVPWKSTVESAFFPEASDSQRAAMARDPKVRADENLSWGFSLVRYHGIEDTREQDRFVGSFMETRLFKQYVRHEELRKKLLATGDAYIVEGNHWHDNFWGNCSCSRCDRLVGQNHLGKILMLIRKRISEYLAEQIWKIVEV